MYYRAAQAGLKFSGVFNGIKRLDLWVSNPFTTLMRSQVGFKLLNYPRLREYNAKKRTSGSVSGRYPGNIS
ncbi:MAG: hypothetical protein ACI96W_003545 [Paraglaciecola sp.]|jgi:hypothetical protein